MSDVFVKSKLLALGLLLLGLPRCAGIQKPTGPAPLCHVELSAATLQEPPPRVWFSLLLHQFDAVQSSVVGLPLDCTGTPLAWEMVNDRCEAQQEQPMPEQRLTAGDLHVEQVDATHRLVWLQVQHFQGGEALGPVALVETTASGLDVRALGSLRAEPDRVQLKLVQSAGVSLLWVESELCTGKGATGCRRSVRLLPQRSTRFIEEPLKLASGACGGPAWFPVKRVARTRESSGWVRSFEFNSTVDPLPARLQVHEQMTVREQDPKGDGVLRVLRQAQSERNIVVRPDGMTVDEPSLWSRVMESQAIH